MGTRIVVVGANGNLGKLCADRLRHRPNCEVVEFARAEMDLERSDSIREALRAVGQFDVLINCAAWTNVDACEVDPAKANQINGLAVGVMGEMAVSVRARVVQVSTDYVFDGKKETPYREDDATGPLGAYGASKLLGEEALLATSPAHLVMRVSWLFGAGGGGFPLWIIQQALKSDALSIVADKWGSPTGAPGAVAALEFFSFSGREATGVVHFSNSGETSWLGWAQYTLDQAREAGLPLKTTQLTATTMENLAAKAGWKALRPVHSALSCERYTSLTGKAPRPWQEAIAEYVRLGVVPSLRGQTSPA